MVSMGSYANDLGSPEAEMGGDAAAGGFFQDSKARHADLKAMLDSSKENLKMEAMRRIIVMVAKGKDASDLFPAVVKNVAAKNLELKKLVYVYLERYAEEQQDLALLSIATFQRGLKDPNQLIRASALRVLSSIRVPMIAPILMLSIKESMRDMSPYVRKVAAHAIPKLYSLDPDEKEDLIAVIDHLLADKATLVAGSAVYAFQSLCPDRNDLIHKHFRKLAQLLVDVDEWGQVIIINTLTRYARTQFTDPNIGEPAEEKVRKFYSSSEDEGEESSKESSESEDAVKAYAMDPDLRMLLRNAKPLLQSRNAAVVLAVAQLFYHLAPAKEVGVIARALIRLLRSHREVQSVILTNIATISAKRPVHLYAISKNMFEPFLKSFFVRTCDPTHIKQLKLEILTNLATQTNISIILREFQTYVGSPDSSFAASTIDAIGRCAANISEVTDVCLSGLVALMSNHSETVVAQSVVVIKKLLQLQPSSHKDIILSMTKLIERVRVGQARASIVWLIGEYAETVPSVAPDVLRKMAKSFSHEEEMVKLQVLNLAVKLYLTNRAQTDLLVQYVFTLAKFDQSYDIRDRARFLRNLVMPEKPNKLTQFSAKVFLTKKPAPITHSTFKDRDQFQLGTLSHYLNQRCNEYHDLPVFPETAPDPTVRNVEGFSSPTEDEKKMSPYEAVKARVRSQREAAAFYSESSGSGETSDSESDSSEGSASKSSGAESSGEESGDESSEETSSSSFEDEKPPPPKPKLKNKAEALRKAAPEKKSKKEKAPAADLLLDLDFGESGSAAAPMPMVPISATAASDGPKAMVKSSWERGPAQFVPTGHLELVKKVSGGGLGVSYRFTRSANVYGATLTSVEMQLLNEGQKDVAAVRLSCRSDMAVLGWPTEGVALAKGASTSLTMGIAFADTTQAAPLEFSVEEEGGETRKVAAALSAPVGEQLAAVLISPAAFKAEQAKLSGLNETSGKLDELKDGLQLGGRAVVSAILQIANLAEVSGTEDGRLWMAGETVCGSSLLLLSLSDSSSGLRLVVNCEKLVIGSMLFKQLKQKLAK